MSQSVSINPLTRIEGHLAIHTETDPVLVGGEEQHRVREARCAGEMYRGFETILRNRDPLDAQQITQRICGVCPISHATASVRAQEMAFGIPLCRNGRLLQNLILAANFLQSHIVHFYQLAALDFVDVTAVLDYRGSDRTLNTVKAWVERAMAAKDSFPAAPFLPRYEVDYVKNADRNAALLAHYVEALNVRRACHEMAAVFGARLPHSTAIFPGGVTQKPTLERILTYRARLKKVAAFVESVYLPDLLAVASEFPDYFELGQGYNNFLSFGVFEMDGQGGKFVGSGAVIDGRWEALNADRIAEDVSHARYAATSPQHPKVGGSKPEPGRRGAYSWVKAPRYGGRPMEVGPLARVMVNYLAPGESWIKTAVHDVLSSLSLPSDRLNSVLGRHLLRGLEARWIARQAMKWLDDVDPNAPAAADFRIPETGSGCGLTEAPRGALGHWLTIEDYRISHYQCMVPTAWNCSPRDAAGVAGPVEKALEGTKLKDVTQPVEVGRVVRSFDPCLACAVH